MAGFFQPFLNGGAGGLVGSLTSGLASGAKGIAGDALKGFLTNDYLRDYTHASKTFVSNAYGYAPKYKFLFHVYFETNDANINIYNGSLGCLISHLRALKYAYENSTDLIIIEDDIKIDSVANIPPAIFKIKGKYDIITMNAQNASGTLYRTDDVVYKFRYTFYHLHFYILKKECYSTIFKNIYPFTDQYDILLGNMNNKLNIYNITGTMSQKNFITNSQNDILLLRGTPVYKQVFIQLDLFLN